MAALGSLAAYVSSYWKGAADKELQGEAARALIGLVSHMVDVEPQTAAFVDHVKTKYGVTKDIQVVELKGSGLMPSTWGNQLVVDFSHLRETVPYGAAELVVAERVDQINDGVLRGERSLILSGLGVGFITGFAISHLRRGKPRTLRRAFPAALLSAFVTTISLSASPTRSSTYHLEQVLHRCKCPVSVGELLSVEEAFSQSTFGGAPSMDGTREVVEAMARDVAKRRAMVVRKFLDEQGPTLEVSEEQRIIAEAARSGQPLPPSLSPLVSPKQLKYAESRAAKELTAQTA
eukprot:Sspe_Gene.12469::Locus_4249_Transcript_1_1_Confidence_1.000_Length_998::g.12469::m.12469